MRRLGAFLARNWPLKIGAIALATVLYGGVVLSEDTRQWPGQVPIDILHPPADAAVLNVPEPVTGIRYQAPIGIARNLTNGSFYASIDLAGIEPNENGEPQRVTVELIAIDPNVRIVEFSPTTVQVLIDPVISRQVPVTVDRGTVPEGLRIGAAQVEPTTVELRGASTRVMSVRTATARVSIDASGINVDQEVEVLPLDETGNVVSGVEVTPDRVRVSIDVARELAFASLPVIPDVVGDVLVGYAITSVTSDPLSVTVSGEEPTIERLTAVRTEPIDVTGRTGTVEVDVPLLPPEEVSVTGGDLVHVTVVIDPADGSRTFEVGLVLAGQQEGMTYELPFGSVLVTLAGPVPVLDSVDVETLRAVVDVADLGPGRASVPVQLTPPDGTTVVIVTPEETEVDVAEAPVPSASPGASPSEPP